MPGKTAISIFEDMQIAEITAFLESIAPLSLQEHYDNAGLLTGDPSWNCTGILCTLDATEAVVQEAIAHGCNLVVSHHPIIFGGLKKINGKNYVEKTVIAAIKNDIALYAIHTNLDSRSSPTAFGWDRRESTSPGAGQMQPVLRRALWSRDPASPGDTQPPDAVRSSLLGTLMVLSRGRGSRRGSGRRRGSPGRR